MATLDEIIIRIIREQELIIGPMAWREAGAVAGLTIVDTLRGEISIESTDPRTVVDQLVARYERLFGRASREVCRDAVASLIATIPVDQVPLSLRA